MQQKYFNLDHNKYIFLNVDTTIYTTDNEWIDIVQKSPVPEAEQMLITECHRYLSGAQHVLKPEEKNRKRN